MRANAAPLVDATATVWRCGGRQCPPGTCDHDEDAVEREPSGAGRAGSGRAGSGGEQQAPPLLSTYRVSSPDDPAEQEADRAADRVARGEAVGIRPSPVSGHVVAAKGTADLSHPPWEDEVMRAQSSPGQPSRTADVDSGIRAITGGGRPLNAETRSFMEERLGHDFTRVRIHTDDSAARTSRSLQAHAFTVGNDIAFAAGQYQPSSGSGRRLLAHELTHVVQQGSAGPVQRDLVQGDPVHGDLVQRDLATAPPAAPVAEQEDLTDAQISSAIAFNTARYNQQNTRLIQELLGGPVTGTWSRENIVAIAATQEEYGLTADGKVGHDTFVFLNNEQREEGVSTASRNCLTAFQVTVGPVIFVSISPASIEGFFRTAAEFSSRCQCSNFEYRQFIRGHARHIRGAVTTDITAAFANIPGGRLPANFVEDGDTTDNPVNYGHRDQPADNDPEDRYIGGQANGCRYRSDDTPGLTDITNIAHGDIFDINVNFRGEIQRNGTVVQTRHWTAINGRFTIP